MAKGKLNKGNRPKQDGYEIVLDPRASEVKQIWVRFGTLDAKRNPKWDRTMDMGPVAFNKRQKKAVAMVHDDQLPAPADSCLYQLLCEIDDKHGHPEILMTKPTKLMSAGKLLRSSHLGQPRMRVLSVLPQMRRPSKKLSLVSKI